MMDRFNVTSRNIKGGRVFAFRGELDLSTRGRTCRTARVG